MILIQDIGRNQGTLSKDLMKMTMITMFVRNNGSKRTGVSFTPDQRVNFDLFCTHIEGRV
jgi:hypothetical protein